MMRPTSLSCFLYGIGSKVVQPASYAAAVLNPNCRVSFPRLSYDVLMNNFRIQKETNMLKILSDLGKEEDEKHHLPNVG